MQLTQFGTAIYASPLKWLIMFAPLLFVFGFSAGLFDMVLNWRISTNPVLVVIVGLAFAVVYYVLFRAVIRWWNLKTPGREDEGSEASVSLDPTAG